MQQNMESVNLLVIHVITLLLLLPRWSYGIPSTTLDSAVETLSTSGHLAMSLTLQLISNTVFLPHSPSLTIFSPNDAAFSVNGQPSLSLLQYHFSPLSFPPHSLFLLSPLSPIPSLLPNHSLSVSPRRHSLFINGIQLSPAPLFNDGNLVIYSINTFLDPDYVPATSVCNTSGVSQTSWFEGGIKALREARYDGMAGFLETQLLGFVKNWGGEMTVLAPTDEEEEGGKMMRYVVGCRMRLDEMEEGVEMKSYEKGYGIKIGRSGDIVLVNDVPVAYPDLFVTDSVVVHGLRGAFED